MRATSKRVAPALFFASLLVAAGEAAAPPAAPARVGPVPAGLRKKLKLSPFYKKHVDAGGFAVLSSEKVSDRALLEAAHLVNQMLANREDVRWALVKNKVRLAVMSPK